MADIKTILSNQNFKAVLNYCLRVLLFLLLCRNYILEPLDVIFMPIVNNFTQNLEGDDALYGFVIILFFPCYILPKICGLFKKLDNLNIFLAIIVILLVDIVFSCSQAITIQLSPLKISFDKINIVFPLILFFFIYRFLKLITKLCPFPFKYIGYVFSIEFFKDIYKDVKKDIRENYLKK